MELGVTGADLPAVNVRLKSKFGRIPDDSSLEAAERAYKQSRAEVELRFRSEAAEWGTANDGNIPSDYWAAHRICASFLGNAARYLECEIENFAALQMNRRNFGSVGVDALREHASTLVNQIRKYYCAPILAANEWLRDFVAQELLPAHWLKSDAGLAVITTHFEEVLFAAEIDIHQAIEQWTDITFHDRDGFFGEAAYTVLEVLAETPPNSATAINSDERPRTLPLDRRRKRQLVHPEVDDYVKQVRAHSGRRITLEHFANVSGYADDTILGAWRRGDNNRCTPAHVRQFEATLRLSFDDFLTKLAAYRRRG